MSFLGLDVGTSGCKAVVFDASGHPLASASREYAVTSSQPHWAELDSRQVGDACLEVIAEAASQCPHDRVQGLGISSQGEAFTLLDGQGNLLANAMVSSDSRAIRQVREFPFDPIRLYEKTGHTAHPIFSLYKLLWLREERPDLWKNAARILCFEDYIHHRLGLEPAISFSLAARTMLFDVREQRWDPEILAASGIRAEQLSRPLRPGDVVGTLSGPVCARLNLAPGAIVVAGGHDQVCAALGCGAIRPGIAALGSGTVECIAAAFSEPILTPALREANLCTYSHAAPGLYATLAYNLSGGNVLRWFRHEWAAPEVAAAAGTGAEVYDLILDLMPEPPTKLMVLPYFTGSGTPHFDNHTPAAILGLRLTTGRGEVLKALLEGLCFELEANLRILGSSGIAVEEIRATGGGANEAHGGMKTKSSTTTAAPVVPAAGLKRINLAGIATTVPAAKASKTYPELPDPDGQVTELVEGILENNAGAALSAKTVFKPTKEFHTARYTLYSAEENMEIDKVVPVAASVKTKLGRGGTAAE